MPTSGTTTFTLDLTDIVEEAFEQAGRPMNSGYDLATARRSLNLLLIEWQNKGTNMWTVEEGSIATVASQAEYDLPAAMVDVIEVVRRENPGVVARQRDIGLQRMSVSGYAAIPNKLTEGTPSQFYIAREQANPVLTLWPVPADTTYSINYWYMRRMEDAGNGPTEPDVPYRFVPALVAGLAYKLACKMPEGEASKANLMLQAEKLYAEAASEDREKVDFVFVPQAYRL